MTRRPARSIRLTSGYFHDAQPTFDPDGKYLLLLLGSHFRARLQRLRQHLDLPEPTLIVAVPLRRDVSSPLAPRNDAETVKGDKKDEGRGRRTRDGRRRTKDEGRRTREGRRRTRERRTPRRTTRRRTKRRKTMPDPRPRRLRSISKGSRRARSCCRPRPATTHSSSPPKVRSSTAARRAPDPVSARPRWSISTSRIATRRPSSKMSMRSKSTADGKKALVETGREIRDRRDQEGGQSSRSRCASTRWR